MSRLYRLVNSPTEEALFEAAARLSTAAQRSAFLDEACKGNHGLRERLEELIVAHLETNGVRGLERRPLDAAAPTLLDAPDQSEGVGEMIGRYKLLEKIGEGGFGVVYMADQTEPVVRRVALKVIKLGMDTKEVIARFEAERQALAMMDDPNIAKVLDVGSTESGRPYFVMELVKGIPITQFCNERQLDTRQRLDLFLDVCSAVQHAHQKGVIHRDLKPSNILVTLHGDKAVPKVIDFGIAKATQQPLTEKTLFTRFDHFVGTPVYMSPEQAALSGLDIDTRSDIYALGVLLYELIAGKPPFDAKSLLSAGYDEMRRIIREEEPPKPSARLSTLAGDERTTIAKQHHAEPDKLGKLVRGDLDWIVMKAMEKDRARRYETANAVAQDIQRHLRNEPVVAAAPSLGYKIQKFVRRNRNTVAAAATIGVLLVAGIAVSSWQAIEANLAKGRETEAREALQSQLGETQKAQEVTKETLERLQAQQAELNVQTKSARLQHYYSSIALADHYINSSQIQRAQHALLTCPPEHRNWEWGYLIAQCHQDYLSFNLNSAQVRMAEFSADNRRLLLLNDSGALEIRSMEPEDEPGRVVAKIGLTGDGRVRMFALTGASKRLPPSVPAAEFAFGT